MRFPCVEAGKVVEREVSPLPLEPAALLEVYDRLKDCTNLFGERENTGANLVEGLYRLGRYIWRVDDVGVVCVVPMESFAAHVHITFWDRRLRGRESLCREFAKSLMEQYGFRVFWTGIPDRSRTTLAFAKRVGFVEHLRVHDRLVLYATRELLNCATPGGSNGS